MCIHIKYIHILRISSALLSYILRNVMIPIFIIDHGIGYVVSTS